MDILADFNSLEGDTLVTLVTFARVSVSAGQDVEVGDDEGNLCDASVVSIEGALITLRVDRSTFRRGPASELALHGGWLMWSSEMFVPKFSGAVVVGPLGTGFVTIPDREFIRS